MDAPAEDGPVAGERARIVLAAAEGRSNEAIATELSVSPHTVSKQPCTGPLLPPTERDIFTGPAVRVS